MGVHNAAGKECGWAADSVTSCADRCVERTWDRNMSLQGWKPVDFFFLASARSQNQPSFLPNIIIMIYGACVCIHRVGGYKGYRILL